MECLSRLQWFWFQMVVGFFVTVLSWSETGPEFPLVMRPVKQSGLWKFWPSSGTVHEGEEKSQPFPSWLGFKSRCSYHDELLCGLKQYLLQLGRAEAKSPGNDSLLPSCCTESCVIVQLSGFTIAFWNYRGQQEPPLLLPHVWLLWISQPSGH